MFHKGLLLLNIQVQCPSLMCLINQAHYSSFNKNAQNLLLLFSYPSISDTSWGWAVPSSAQLRLATTSLKHPTRRGCWSCSLEPTDTGWENEIAVHLLGLPTQSAVTRTESLANLRLRIYWHWPAIELWRLSQVVGVVGWWWVWGKAGNKAKAQLQLGLQA